MGEPLDSGQVLDDLSGLPPDMSDTGNLPVEEQAPAPDPAELQRRLSELEKELETRDKRMRDTQTDWQRLNAEKLDAQRRAEEAARIAREHEFRTQQWEQWAATQQQQQNARPIELDPREKEALLTDPDYLNQRLYDTGRMAYETAKREFLPAVQQLQAQIAEQRASLAPVYDQAADLAAYRAEQIAVSNHGMQPEDFRSHYEPAARVMWNVAVASAQREGGDALTRYNNMRVNPQAVVLAVQMARNQSGAPVSPTFTPPTPPSAGNNQTRTNSRQVSKTREQSDIERSMGVKFTADEVKAIREKARVTAMAAEAKGAW